MKQDTKIWLVLRTDNAGNAFLLEDRLDEGAAATLVDRLTARGHKQTYGAHAYGDASERAALLQRFNAKT